MKILSFLLLITLLTPQFLRAQNEIARERSSLKGIREIGIVVNIEKPMGLSH